MGALLELAMIYTEIDQIEAALLIDPNLTLDYEDLGENLYFINKSDLAAIERKDLKITSKPMNKPHYVIELKTKQDVLNLLDDDGCWFDFLKDRYLRAH